MRRDKRYVERERGNNELMTKFRYYDNKGLILSVTLLIPFAIMMLSRAVTVYGGSTFLGIFS